MIFTHTVVGLVLLSHASVAWALPWLALNGAMLLHGDTTPQAFLANFNHSGNGRK